MSPSFTTRIRSRIMIKFLFALLIGFSLTACAPHVIYQHAYTSRDFTYLEFARNTAPYVHKDQVGGEHSTFIKVLGFEGDHFTVEMKKIGDAGFTVYGDGVRVHRTSQRTDIQVESENSLFTVEISAMTYGEYELKIVKTE